MRWAAGLLARFRSGDAEVLDGVYRRYVDVVTRVVGAALRRYGGGAITWRDAAADLPDLVQEVFARAFDPRTRKRFDGVRDYGPFLSQIARNVTVDYLRRRRRQEDIPGDVDQLFEAIAAGAAPRDLGEEIAERETMRVVADYMANLPPELRHAHEMLYVRGLSEREAAAALGVGRQVVRTLGARLREGLRRALEAEGPPAGQPTRLSTPFEQPKPVD